MKFNFKQSMNLRRRITSGYLFNKPFEYKLDEELLLNIILLGSMKQGDVVYEISKQENYDAENLEVKMLVNEVEIDLGKGLRRLVEILNEKDI